MYVPPFHPSIYPHAQPFSQSEAGELITAGLSERDLFELGTLFTYHPEGASLTPHAETIDALHAGGDVTIFKSVGVGVQDVAISYAVVDRAVQEGIGRVIEGYDDKPSLGRS